MISRSLGHRAPLLWLVLPLMAGLAAGKCGGVFPILWSFVGAGLMAIIAVTAAWRDWPAIWSMTVVGAMSLASAGIYPVIRHRLDAWETLPPREVRISLRVDRIFPKADPRKSSGLATVIKAGPPVQDLAGQRVYFSLGLRQGAASPIPGAVVTAAGVLSPLPRDTPANSFDGYLANGGINFRLNRGKILGAEEPASRYRKFCADTLARLSAILGHGVEAKRPDLVGVFRAMLLGQQHELTEAQNVLFRQSGTMHVFSISDLHIAVIATALIALLSLLRTPTIAALVINLVTLWLYVDITGMAPSAVRAYGMVAFVQVALTLRVARNPLSALTASALIVLLLTPLDIFSASFQMSYGIVLALLVMGLPLADCWQEALALFRNLPRNSWTWHHRLRDWLWRPVLSACAIGLASALVSAVTGALFFNLLTPGALLANLWVIPASSAVILFGLVSLLCGLVGFAFGTLVANHAAVLTLWLIDLGLRTNVRLPGMSYAVTFRAPWVGPAALVVLLASLLVGYAWQWRGWCRGFWLPFAVVAFVLLLGLNYQ